MGNWSKKLSLLAALSLFLFSSPSSALLTDWFLPGVLKDWMSVPTPEKTCGSIAQYDSQKILSAYKSCTGSQLAEIRSTATDIGDSAYINLMAEKVIDQRIYDFYRLNEMIAPPVTFQSERPAAPQLANSHLTARDVGDTMATCHRTGGSKENPNCHRSPPSPPSTLRVASTTAGACAKTRFKNMWQRHEFQESALWNRKQSGLTPDGRKKLVDLTKEYRLAGSIVAELERRIDQASDWNPSSGQAINYGLGYKPSPQNTNSEVLELRRQLAIVLQKYPLLLYDDLKVQGGVSLAKFLRNSRNIPDANLMTAVQDGLRRQAELTKKNIADICSKTADVNSARKDPALLALLVSTGNKYDPTFYQRNPTFRAPACRMAMLIPNLQFDEAASVIGDAVLTGVTMGVGTSLQGLKLANAVRVAQVVNTAINVSTAADGLVSSVNSCDKIQYESEAAKLGYSSPSSAKNSCYLAVTLASLGVATSAFDVNALAKKDFWVKPAVEIEAVRYGAITNETNGHILEISGNGATVRAKPYSGASIVEDRLGSASSKFKAAESSHSTQQQILDQTFNAARKEKLAQFAAKTDDGRPLVFYRTVSKAEVEELLDKGTLSSTALFKKNPNVSEDTILMLQERLHITAAQARELMTMPPGPTRAKKVIEYAGVEAAMDSHNQDVIFLDPFKSVSLGPHYSPKKNEYVIIVYDTHQRAFRNPTGDYEGEWLFFKDLHSDEVGEVLTYEEAIKRFGHNFTPQRIH